VYFERLQGFDAKIITKCTENLDGHSSTVNGLKIRVMEETIATASRLPISSKRWFFLENTTPRIFRVVFA
jgi:hypothetical protein